jgi:hypothetical protein
MREATRWSSSLALASNILLGPMRWTQITVLISAGRLISWQTSSLIEAGIEADAGFGGITHAVLAARARRLPAIMPMAIMVAFGGYCTEVR